MKRTLSALVVSGALLCAAALPAMAAEPAAGSQNETALVQEETMPDSVLYYGQVLAIDREEDGTITRLHLTSEAQGDYVMNISSSTVWIDSGSYAASDPSTLEVGESVYVRHSPVSTRSLPPQSAAYAVVRNFPQDAGAAQYHEVEAIAQNEDGSVTITTDNGSLWLTVEADASVTTYAGETAALADVKAGDHVMAWYPLVMLSYPGQASAGHLMLLPAAVEERDGEADSALEPIQQVPQEGAELTILLEGDMVLPVTGKYESGVATLPVAAVAQALGYEVTYTPAQGDQEPLVTVESDDFRVEIRYGKSMFGVTKIEGAVGMTAPMDCGVAPYAVDPGTTWVPAQMFEMLGRTVTLEENTISIQ